MINRTIVFAVEIKWWMLLLLIVVCGVHLWLERRENDRSYNRIRAMRQETDRAYARIKAETDERLQQLHEDSARSRQEQAEWWTKHMDGAWRESERSL